MLAGAAGPSQELDPGTIRPGWSPFRGSARLTRPTTYIGTNGHGYNLPNAITRYTERLARALAHVINLLDPDVIVLGGGLSNIASLYDEVPALWSGFVFSDHVATRLVRNRHGDSSGVRGAAWLWPE